MPKLIQRVYAPKQSGKTTAAAALALGYRAIGIHAAYIAQTEVQAIGVSMRHGVPRANVYAWSNDLVNRGMLDHYQAIILDEAQVMRSSEGDAIDRLARRYRVRVVPFPTLIGFYCGEPPDEEGRDNASN
ncbi:TPA: AAA family ATPase [Burkholderia contaminans]|uniref:AAA family ATPase n=1 Tax=Burkholderia contaminans TaxID=488447 RepID=UPI000D008D6E|nr:AAA family ATPase [Burkholderia contaminans]HDR9065506.1 AAA family ATPase [Burkholderia vietnamiensis]MBM6427945.1 AAA family ATPase [Burkholderia contaminans]MCA7876776.1 AAA family ATPase [Burkholderia contaminans]MDN8024201.1 AAA family ATPase [Burkholderia contaminans]PRG12201.1 hypothetical protein C6Q17_14180 [Burkholderia contaminans]